MTPEPLRLSLAEALELAAQRGWGVSFAPGTACPVLIEEGNDDAWWGRTWPEAFSNALGRPVVERDDKAELVKALQMCADELAVFIEAQYEGTLEHPVQKRRYERDMRSVFQARAALAAVGEGDDGP